MEMCSCVGVGVERGIYPPYSRGYGDSPGTILRLIFFLRENLVHFELTDGQEF